MSGVEKAPAMTPMPDLQQSPDTRKIAIDKVGVKDIGYPVVVQDKHRERQHTVARVNMYVDLPEQFKGTHMSRFIEVLNLYHGEISVENIETILGEMKQRLEAGRAHLELSFPYFIEKTGTGLPGPQPSRISVPDDRNFG